ncbi:MAG: hypothetical protein ACYTEG_17670, partial [Planctomycetota bacterium]
MKQACLLLLAGVALASPKKDCTKDVNAAIKELKKQCGELIRVKKINWNKVGAAAKKQTKKVKTDQ